MTAMRRGRKRRNWDNAPQMAVSRLGDERQLAPITLAKLNLAVDDEREAKETAERIALVRTIRAGRDAWQAIGKAESFSAWQSIGAALAIGKAHSLKVTGANRAAGQHYCREFGKWVRKYGFDQMPKSSRSVAILLHENATAIEEWRATLPERQR